MQKISLSYHNLQRELRVAKAACIVHIFAYFIATSRKWYKKNTARLS